jgi:hypothetical protein
MMMNYENGCLIILELRYESYLFNFKYCDTKFVHAVDLHQILACHLTYEQKQNWASVCKDLQEKQGRKHEFIGMALKQSNRLHTGISHHHWAKR